MSNQRGHFRLEYPKPDRPAFKIGKDSYEVLDLSEKGVKFACDGKYKPKEGGPIAGRVVFKDGKHCDVAGTILRYLKDKDQCVVVLDKGIPYPKMMEEQLHILRKYKPGNE